MISMYRVAKVFEARDYKGNPDLIINCMVSMKDEMFKKFGTVYDEELEWHIHVSIYHILYHHFRNYFRASWGDEEILGVKVIVEDAEPQITLRYNERIGDYRMGTFSKLCWDELCVSLSDSSARIPRIKKVIFNEPATIVLWDDGTKTVVKCENDMWDEEKGLAMAICKKLIGLKEFYKHYNKAFDDKWERVNI